MKKLRLLGAVCAMLVYVSNVNAAIVSFSVDTSVTQGGTEDDFPNTLIVLPVGAASIVLDPGASGVFLEVGFTGTGGTMGPDGTIDEGTFSVIDGATNDSNAYLELFAQGETVGASTFNAAPGNWSYALWNNIAGSNWSASFADQYIGFRTVEGNYGYLNVNWTYNASSGIGTLDFLSGAVETVPNTAITIDAVPIPAAVWLFGSGLLGLVGMARRKKA